MIPSMDGMLDDLRLLTDRRLLAALHDEVRRERHITLKVLLLLIAVEQRRLHIDRYSSLFAYCTDQLKYSNSAAGRRIAGARCLRDHPRAWPMLFDGRLNLTTLCIIARVITPENADELLERAGGGTQRQVEDLAAKYGGPKPVRDRIKPVRSLHRSARPTSHNAPETASSTSQSASHSGADMNSQTPPGSGAGTTSQTAAGSGAAATGGCDTSHGRSAKKSPSRSNRDDDMNTDSTRSNAANEPLTYEVTFRADADFVEKLRRLQALLATDPNSQLAPIFDRAIELALDRYDPKRRQSRRELRRTRKAAKASDGATGDTPEAAGNRVETSSEASNEVDNETSSETSNETKGGIDGQAGNEARNESSTEANHQSNNERSSATIDGKNERRSSIPSRQALPRRTAMTPRRKIPQWLRDLVLLRDGHRCTYVGPDGRCPAVTELEIDHICPHAHGGSDHIDNLRTFCRAHNQRAAEIVFGSEFMRRCRGEEPSSPETKPFIVRTGDSVDSDEVAPLEAVLF